MRETLTVGLLTLALLTVRISAADDSIDSYSREDQVHNLFPRHPLYDSLPHNNRRVLSLGEADELPNYVSDADANDTPSGDAVTGYNLPDSFSAPSYADPTLLSAVMKQADQANFRYPLVTTVPPGSNQSNSASETGSTFVLPEDNEINPFSLFPPQFYELLEIPLHTYSNGTSYSPHHRYHPVGPLISKGYASTKIQGNNKVRTGVNQDTPQVVYKPMHEFTEATKKPVDNSQITTTSITTKSSYSPYRPTDPPTTRPPSTTQPPPTTRPPSTTQPPPTTRPPSTTQPPPTTRPPSTIQTTQSIRPRPTPYNTRLQPTTQDAHIRPTSPPYRSHPAHLPFRPPSTSVPQHPPTRPDPTYTSAHPQPIHSETYTWLSPPSNIPPLRYTRRPTAGPWTTPHSPPSTSPHSSTHRPTTLQPTTTPLPVTQQTTTQPDFWLETVEVTPRSTPKKPVHPYGTRIPSRNPQLHPKPVEQAVPSSTEKPNPLSSTVPKPSLVDRQREDQTFRPSKVDPFLPPRQKPTSYHPLIDKDQPERFPPNVPQPLPPVVNAYDLPTRQPQPVPTLNIEATRPPAPLLSSLPPPPQPPKRPFQPRRPPPPSILSGRPSLPPPPPRPLSSSPFLPPLPGFQEQSSGPSHRQRPTQESSRPQKPQFVLRPPAPFSRPGAQHSVLSSVPFVPPQSRPHHGFKINPEAPQLYPPFQIVPAAGTHPPHPQDLDDQPEPGFTLPAEAGNLPGRPSQDENLIRPQLDDTGPNVLPQFRPNAPPQRETFGFQDHPARVFTTRPRPLHPDRRPVLSKRPSFLENFNFFGRPPVNRRRGETGPLLETNSAGNKLPNRLTEDNGAVRYQLTHGPIPKHAQKVMVIGPFKQPPPGAPVINLPDRDLPPPITFKDPSLLPPPPPPIPSHRISPPPLKIQEAPPSQKTLVTMPLVEVKSQPSISRRTYSVEGVNRIAPPSLPTPQPLVLKSSKPLRTSPVHSNTKKDKKKVPVVVYGRPVDPIVYGTQTHRILTDVSSSFNVSGEMTGSTTSRVPLDVSTVYSNDFSITNNTNTVEEVSDEHKEAIIAGKIRFPSMSGVERSGQDTNGLFPPGIIPIPVPILPQQHYASRRVPSPQSATNSFWSFLGFGESKPTSAAADRHVRVANQGAQYTPTKTIRHHSHWPNPTRVDRPLYSLLPPPPHALPPRLTRLPEANRPQPVHVSHPHLSSTPATTPSPSSALPPAPAPSSGLPATQRSLLLSTRNPKPTELRPVYEHTTTTITTPLPVSATRPSPPSTTQPTTLPTATEAITPLLITEYSTHYARVPSTHGDRKTFKAPVIESASYSGWKVVGVPPTPAEGPGAALNPVVSYVKENIPEIIIKAPATDMEEEVVTGVISDRMGEVQDDQMVQFSSKLNVQTPGIVRSYWVKAPVLA